MVEGSVEGERVMLDRREERRAAASGSSAVRLALHLALCATLLVVASGASPASADEETAAPAPTGAGDTAVPAGDDLTHPGSPAADIVREGFAHVYASRSAEAHAAGLRAIERDPASADAYDLLGAALMLEQKHEQALDAHRRSAELAPESSDPYVNRIPSLRALGREEEALESARTAVRLEPSCGYCHSELALSLAHLRRFAESAQAAREAVRITPEDARAHNLLGMALLYTDDAKDALPSFEAALRLTETTPVPHVKLDALQGIAMARLRLGEHAAAATAFRQVLELAPRHRDAHVYLGDALAWQGDFAGAAGAYASAIEIDAKTPEIRYRLGQTYLQLGRVPEAITQLESLVALAPASLPGHAALVVAYQRDGRDADAAAQLDKLQAIDAGFAERLRPMLERCEASFPEA